LSCYDVNEIELEVNQYVDWIIRLQIQDHWDRDMKAEDAR